MTLPLYPNGKCFHWFLDQHIESEKRLTAEEIQQNREELLTCLHSVVIDDTNTKVNTKSVLRLWGMTLI